MVSTAYLLLNGEWRLGGGANAAHTLATLAVFVENTAMPTH